MSRLMKVVWAKEWRDALRDRRSLMTLVLIVINIPFILYFALKFSIDKASQDKNEAITLLVRNADQAPTLIMQLKQAGVTIQNSSLQDDAAITRALGSNKVAGLLVLDEDYRADYLALRPAKMSLWSNSALEQDAQLRKIKRQILQYQASAAEWRLVARGVAPTLVRPVVLQEYDVAGQGARAGALLSMAFGMVFWGVFGIGSSMVIDATAGERERRTLELLMAQPVNVWDVVLGKWLAASMFCLVGLMVQLALVHFALLQLPLEEIGMSWNLGVGGFVQLLLSGVPLCLFAAALTMALAMNTKTFKEAQSTVSIAVIVPMLPVFVIPMLNLGTQKWMFAVPITGHAEMVKAIAKGQALVPLEWLLLAGVPLLASLLLVTFCAMRLRSERFVIGV